MDKKKIFSEKNSIKFIIFYVLILLFISRAMFYCVFVIHDRTFSFERFLSAVNIWDCGYYRDIIVNGYPTSATKTASWAFFPLYPLTVKLVTIITGLSIDLSGFILSNICCFISCIYAWRYIMRTRNNIEEVKFYLSLMVLGVCGFYESIMYTEAMYLMFLTMSFVYMEEGHYPKMGLCGALLSATRNTGVFFVFAILFHWIKKSGAKSLKDFVIKTFPNTRLVLGTMMVPLGLFLFMHHLWRLTGDPLAFVHIQKAFMLDTKPGMFNVFYRAIVIYGRQLWFWGYCGGLLLILAMICTCKRNSERVWGAINWLIPFQRGMGCQHRYLHISLVTELIFSDLCMKFNKKIRWIILGVMILAEVVLMYLWIDGNGWLV